jgi:hypothetical protein
MFHDHLKFVAIAASLVALSAVSRETFATPGNKRPLQVVVPTDYPTIQSAIDAVKPGGTVWVLPGTYTEQILIPKDLDLVGSGVDTTIIRAPAILVPGPLGSPSIVEIFDGAAVSISDLTVSGPAAVGCGDPNVLRWGVRVHPGSHMVLARAAVRDIHNTPMAMCPRSGTAISVGSGTPDSPPASLVIQDSEVTNFQALGIIVLGAGSWADIAHNTVTGPGHAGGVPTNGIEVVAGAAGNVVHNIVSGNVCPAGIPEVCGDDFFTQVQEAGIVAAENGPGTVISHNLVIGNQIGLFLSECEEIAHNVMVDNEYFGLALFGLTDGAFAIEGGEIIGGGGGLWVTAVFVDMTVALKSVSFSGLSGPAVEILEDGGATGTVITEP